MRPRARGFTLIELVVTVAIVGILASIAVPLSELGAQRSREHELRSALRQIREALDSYRQATEDGRVARRTDGSGYPSSLEELAGGVPNAKSPTQAQIYFLRRLPRDPFFPRAEVAAAETWGRRTYASPPDAPSEGEDVFDVYSTSDKIGLNGVAYRAW